MRQVRYRLEMEQLESRLVLDNYYFRGAISSSWATPGNWFDQTTNQIATRQPNSGDDVYFDNQSANRCDLISNSYTCRSINSLGGWNSGILAIDDASLNVWGTNNPPGGSVFNYGQIVSDTGPGTLNIIGSTFYYRPVNLNQLPDPHLLTIYVNNNAAVTFTSNLTWITATLNIGYLPDEAESFGTVSFTGLTGPVTYVPLALPPPQAEVNISSVGTFNLSGTLNEIPSFVSSGHVNLVDGASLGMASGTPVQINAGVVQAGESAVVNITGDVDILNAILRIGDMPNSYASLNVSGTLTMGEGSTLSVDVNSTNNQSDAVYATNINLDSTDVLDCFTDGGAVGVLNAQPDGGTTHQYLILSASNSLQGEFGSYEWLGTGTIWTPTYTTATLTLS